MIRPERKSNHTFAFDGDNRLRFIWLGTNRRLSEKNIDGIPVRELRAYLNGRRGQGGSEDAG